MNNSKSSPLTLVLSPWRGEANGRYMRATIAPAGKWSRSPLLFEEGEGKGEELIQIERR
jgi:hypothetical protein